MAKTISNILFVIVILILVGVFLNPDTVEALRAVLVAFIFTVLALWIRSFA